MITANEFDLVFDCQQVFKQLMQAMANPGKVFSIGQNSAKLHQPSGSLLAIAMTLVDSRCRFSVAGVTVGQQLLGGAAGTGRVTTGWPRPCMR